MARWSLGEPISWCRWKCHWFTPRNGRLNRNTMGLQTRLRVEHAKHSRFSNNQRKTQLPTLRNVPHEMETTAQTRQQRNTGVSGRGGSPTGRTREFYPRLVVGRSGPHRSCTHGTNWTQRMMKTWKIRPMTDCEGHCNPQEEKDRARHATWNAWWQYGSLPCRLVQKTWHSILRHFGTLWKAGRLQRTGHGLHKLSKTGTHCYSQGVCRRFCVFKVR